MLSFLIIRDPILLVIFFIEELDFIEVLDILELVESDDVAVERAANDDDNDSFIWNDLIAVLADILSPTVGRVTITKEREREREIRERIKPKPVKQC